MRRKVAALLSAGLLGLAGAACEATGEIEDQEDGLQIEGDIDVDENNNGGNGDE